MLLENLEIFCKLSDKYKQRFTRYLNSAAWNHFTKLMTVLQQDFDDDDRNIVFDDLCAFLMEPKCAKDVARCFPQYLPLLLSRAIRTDFSHSTNTNETNELHRLNSVILGTLISINPDVLGFTLKYFERNPAPFSSALDDSTVITKRRRENDVPFAAREASTLEIVTASYDILDAAPEHFKRKWNWSEFYDFLLHEDDAVKWIALKCVGIILGMSERTRFSCARSLMRDPERFLPQERQDNSATIGISSKNHAEEMSAASKNLNSLVSIAGIVLPVLDTAERTRRVNLVRVPSMESNLRRLALAVASRRCVCLEGPVGCGKTALVEYLAEATGHDGENFVKVQLGDQTDSKMLLGNYRCTDVPGEFVWQPGVLTQAVMDGKWLLLEDIDSAALDVASCLGNLIETGTLSVPGYRDAIRVKSGFHLFLTQRTMPTASGFYRRSSGASDILEKHWFRVHVESLTRDELAIVVKTLFPSLTTIATRIIDVFLLFSVGNEERNARSEESFARTGRLTSTRDLVKWCTRAIVDFRVSSPDSALKIFQDAIDIFCCSVSEESRRLELATAIGHTLGIVKTKAEYFINVHKPTIGVTSDFFQAGRARLLRKKASYASVEKSEAKFSFTRPSANLLERVACCVARKEPVLLVGETGTGKTSSVQYLARSTGHKLVVINMNQQSESADLLGGYKPVDVKHLVAPTRREFEILFRCYFATEPNRKFLEHVAACYDQQKWKTLVRLMLHSAEAAVKRLKTAEDRASGKKEEKRPRSGIEMLAKWEKMLAKLEKLKTRVKTHFSLAFAFLEGSLIKALKNGYWVLLDEINLASSETLECLTGLLEGATGSLSLLERGDDQTITRHSDFTIFACMNPATDVGKKELPIGLRNRFTEFYVDELNERKDLELLVNSYLGDGNLTTDKQESIVKFYLNVRKEALTSLNDGTGHKPHYSLRTLCRALGIASANPCGNLQRSLYEAFSLSFLTQLDNDSYPIVERTIARAILDGKMARAVLSTPIPKPPHRDDENYTNFEGYWIVQGDLEIRVPDNYILTTSVRKNLRDLVRVVSIGKMPVLLQGDTSVGKTSLITYLAKSSGHTCLRINNHEHTDLQEYVGNYVADENGKLLFKEGILVEAMRKGHWIILDELNLAPSDVLEALNRVLDDNRELFIPETQQTVKAHENFMLFATQNPPGLYGGRKVLSRAFRNRFVELHFDEIPPDELRTILHERCHMPLSYCKQIINVMIELQTRRKSTATFQGKHGFITLRDLFRWGERYRLADDVGDRLYDWSQHLADEGYLVLAAKVRKSQEADEIRQVIGKHLKRDVDPANLFTLNEKTSRVTRPILEEILRGASSFDHVVWTYHMRRMAVLVRKSCRFKEPVLLVGETGGGKTTVCQLIASMMKQRLYSVNCHMHTESSDFIGNLRPVRDHSDPECQKLFEWVDGPLVTAMRKGDLFLADEISLADDSVLERLNSLLEPERCLLLAEKSVDTVDSGESDCVITANEKFQFVGTMNPGGDYGKKELSPALRNRFTEIWCEGCVDESDLEAIIVHNLNRSVCEKRRDIARSILAFVDWLKSSEIGKRFTVSIRDILTWVNFINRCTGENEVSRLSLPEAYVHGAHLAYIDGLGSGLTGMESAEKLEIFRKDAQNYLEARANDASFESAAVDPSGDIDQKTDDDYAPKVFGISPFFIAKGANSEDDGKFTFSAPTTRSNSLKLLRALQLKKPLLLEGSPGVGKTSLVAALAKSSGHNLLRINLSDQTDVSDLFGADLPLEGGKSGQFAWKDGPFLRALRAGDWILLDELNLASQSVLEGLNACLDHRGEIYIPELARTFAVKPATKLFACQNPPRQGGARRGLPKSFLNRFTQVYVDALNDDDLELIASKQFPQLPPAIIEKMINFNSILSREAGTSWGHSGSPWEMNLRDIIRWCEIVVAAAPANVADTRESARNPGDGVELVYVDRMRTEEDRRRVREIYERVFPVGEYPAMSRQPIVRSTEREIYLGDASLPREERSVVNDRRSLLLRDQLGVLRSLARCVRLGWMPILVGGPGCGKSSVVRVLAQLTGQKLKSVVVNSAMDTTEILGGFEQTDYNRHLEQLLEQVEGLLLEYIKLRLSGDGLKHVVEYHSWLEKVQNLSHDEDSKITMTAETELFLRRTKELWKLVTAMKSLENAPLEELRSIDEKLRNLANDVKRDKCLNAGGKFEWVDSILVKCLREGSWLLLDQVNLCSPAVLDRLNGLLEPGGVLTIGERGVGNDGNVLTIKPHKNFRLFLTMDPRYGEISRAMRNRGVEIYMLGHKENRRPDILDLKSLLDNLGLRGSNHQEALLEIHEAMSSEDAASEKPSPVHLLHSAFLINQQISRGFSADEAFRASCIDVYVKSRYVQRANAKKNLECIIDRSISRHDVTGMKKNVFDLAALTPKIRDFQENSKLTIIKQQGFVLDALSRFIESVLDERETNDGVVPYPTTSVIDEFFVTPRTNETEKDFDVVKILPHLLLSFYEKSSRSDARLRQRWLREIFSRNGRDTELSRQLEERNEILANLIEDSTRVLATDSLTCDFVDLPNLSEDYHNRLGRLNCLALILYLNSMNNQYFRVLDDMTLDKSANIISVLQYSNSVYHGKLTSHLKNQPLVTNFVILIAQLNSCVNLILGDDSTLLTSEEYVKYRKNVAWIERFYSLGSLPFVDKTSKTTAAARENFAETNLMLRVHYKWLVKFVKDLFVLGEKFLVNETCKREMEKLAEMMENIDRSVKTVDDPFGKMTKRIKKYLAMPLPFSSEATTTVFSLMKKLSGELELCTIERGDSVLKADLKIILLQKDEIMDIRGRLINAWRQFYKNQRFDETFVRDLRDIEEIFQRLNLSLRTPAEISQALGNVPPRGGREIIDMSANVQLWPIYEYMFYLLANNLHRKISQDRAMECRTDALEKLSKVPSLPVNIIGLFDSIINGEIGTKDRDRAKWEIFTRLDIFTRNSRGFEDSNGILHWRGITADAEASANNFDDRKIVNPTDSPVLVNFVSQLIINESRGKGEKSILATAPLGAYRSRLRQLKTLNDVLWRNSVALNSSEYDKEQNDRSTLMSCLRVFLKAEEEMAREGDAVRVLRSEISREKEANGASELEVKFQRDYVEPLNELRGKARALASSPEWRNNEEIERAKTWILLGYVQVFFFGNLGYIDPIHKIGLKLGYIDEDIEDCARTMYAASLDSRINGDSFPSLNTHSRIIEMRESLVGLKKARNDLTARKAIRPSCLDFIALANETSNFRNTLASRSTVEGITNKLSRAIEELTSSESSVPVTADDAIQQAETWRESLLRFSEQLDAKFLSGYPDMVVPLLTAVAQLRHGARSLCERARKCQSLARSRVGKKHTDRLLGNLVRFPTIGHEQEDLPSLVEICTSSETREIIDENLKNGDSSLVQQFRMVKVGLLELYNHANLEGKLEPALWRRLDDLLRQIVLIWRKQREDNEKLAAEKDSLYRNKAKIYGDASTIEDEEISRELRALFPNSRDDDFMDIEMSNATLEQTETRRNNEDDGRYVDFLTDDNLSEIHGIHSRIVNFFVEATWLRKRIDKNGRDYVAPLIQRYETFHHLLENLLPIMNYRLSTRLYAGMNFLTFLTARTSDGEVAVGKTYDFYRSSNVQEAKQCLTLLETIIDGVDCFLKEWPDHPTLRSIRSIIERIHGFPVTSPISRFLTGLELLLVKMKEWEENAHSGVSLGESSLSLTRQIISWRKLELACWKDCLNAARERLASKASKWWFFLYALVESYTTNTRLEIEMPASNENAEEICKSESVTPKKLVELLEGFIGGSSLVEFQPRLDLLLTFHRHACNSRESDERNELLAILWNVRNYYAQFSRDVERRMKSMRAPIEKKLRDFVKIARWNDINYWSVRETVDKTHRTLHKFIREYETGLKTSAAVCLIVEPSAYGSETDKGEWDRSKERDYTIDPRDFIRSDRAKAAVRVDEKTRTARCVGNELISRMESLFGRAKRLSKETILLSSYPGLRIGLEEFMENVASHAARLRSMEVDRTLPRAKQKSHAKSILQRKRMALADYFKNLSHIGLSYRRGSLAWKNHQSRVIDLTVPPVDLRASLEAFQHGKADKQMLAQWEGCDDYYYKSLIKLNALNVAFAKTRSDLGMPNMDRCCGFSCHIMLMAHKQKRLIVDSIEAFASLRRQVVDSSEIGHRDAIIRDRDLHDCARSLKKLLVTLRTCLEQLMLYLEACPADPGLDSDVEIVELERSELAIVNATKNDPVWRSTASLLQSCLTPLSSIVESHDKLFHSRLVVLAPIHHEFLNAGNKILLDAKQRVRELSRVFSSDTEKSHPILESIDFMESRIDQWTEKFLLLEIADCSVEDSAAELDDDASEYTANVELVVKTILLAIQRKYKETTSYNESAVHETNENEETRDARGIDDDDINGGRDGQEAEEDHNMEENSFRERLIESLEKDIDGLRLKDVHRYFSNVLKMSNASNPRLTMERRGLIVRLLPLVEQYLLFSQFYLNEQVGAFRTTCKMLHLQLSVFLDLATNGFCLPKDLDVEEGEGEEAKDGKTQNGMGLGDGEGEKDVSDRIESEDQLEDARPADRERDKDEDKDCKEEENGIDMSEDFEGKMQDLEKNEENENEDKSENEDEDDDDDLDKQMGETEKGADALDEEIWGKDEDESSNENEDDRENENEGKGEEIGEKEMTAKDDSSKKEDNDENNESGDKEEREKPEINEIDEPEVNDDQIDPYHGNQEPPPEPEPMDLSDDMNLDGEEPDDKAPPDAEENPFDIDEMKDCAPPPEKEEIDGEEERKEEENKAEADDSSDEEENEASTDVKSANDEDPVENEEAGPENANDASVETPEKKEENEGEDNKEKEEEDDGSGEKAAPDLNNPSKEMDATDEIDSKTEGTRDKMADRSNRDEQQDSTAENNEDESNNRGTGNAESEHQETGHAGNSMENTAPMQRRVNDEQTEKRKNPGESDENRTLVDEIQPDRKKMRMIHSREETTKDNEEEEEGAELDEDDNDVEMCQHVKNSERYDHQAVDAATKEQVKRQVADKEDEEEREESMDVDANLDDEEESKDKEDDETIEQTSEAIPQGEKDREKRKNESKSNQEDGRMESVVEVEGDVAATMRIDRGSESAFFTNILDTSVAPLSSAQLASKRMEVETMLSKWTCSPSSGEALAAWNCLNSVVEVPARDLAEKLRLVLEPTRATRLKGDYRTGRRINMRKIIPYIASQFRKDKIWLRRTKPSKRDYQIVLALDDSSSMADNHSKELAFESLSLISKAMGYLEVGELSVISFGETANILHPLGQPFTENSGSRLIQEMRFEQKKTKVGQLVDFTVDMFDSQKSSSDSAKLLVVLSDGRGVFSEGSEQVNSAVRRAKLADIFLVFIIVDNPLNKDSILDIRMPVFEGGKLLGIKSYMDTFPFPFYMILRDINALPGVLSDALRQWFEVVGKIDT